MMPRRLRSAINFLQKHANAWWYAPAIAVAAALDAFVVIIPTDGLLVSACMLAPRRWIATTLIVTFGSCVGAWALAFILKTHGLPFLLHISPGLDQSSAWIWSNKLMTQWGTITLFVIALSPIMQQPVVALAAIAGMPLTQVFLMVFAGRVIKYGVIAWISTHAPGVLKKLWGMNVELQEVGAEKLVESEIKGPHSDKPHL